MKKKQTEIRKICVITGNRAEYGIMSRLMRLIVDEPGLELQLIVTGSHLNKSFGLTYRELTNDGFKINKKINIFEKPVISSIETSLAMGRLIPEVAVSIKDLEPDIIMVLGDRYEIFSVVSAALVSLTPVAHISGGEITEGAFDDTFRHCITKMSHIHFTASEKYRKRVIQLGEQPENVFNFGDLALDNIKNMKLMRKTEFEESISKKLKSKNLLITFHPVTLEKGNSEGYFRVLLQELDRLEDTLLIFTSSNSDPEGVLINNLIKEYVNSNDSKALYFKSLGHHRYLSAMQFVDAVVGNSSSGVVEAPAFRIGTINIGSRQEGRMRMDSIIDCEPNSLSIREAIEELFSPEFKSKLKKFTNPLEGKDSAKRMLNVLKTINLNDIEKKKFFTF